MFESERRTSALSILTIAIFSVVLSSLFSSSGAQEQQDVIKLKSRHFVPSAAKPTSLAEAMPCIAEGKERIHVNHAILSYTRSGRKIARGLCGGVCHIPLVGPLVGRFRFFKTPEGSHS